MTRAQRQNETRQATVPDATLQPILDALCTGLANIGHQKHNLTKARDLVQTLNVKADNDTSKPNNTGQCYFDCAVKAYQSALDTYGAIFEELANVTAADPAKEAENGHDGFKQMAESVRLAMRATAKYVLLENIGKTDAHTATEIKNRNGGRSEASSEELPKAVDPTPRHAGLLALLNDNGKRPASASDSAILHVPGQPPAKRSKHPDPATQPKQEKKVLWLPGDALPRVPYATLGSSERKEWKHEKLRQKREKKRAKRAGMVSKEIPIPPLRRTLNADDAPPSERHQEDASKPMHDRDFISLDSRLENGAIESMQAQPTVKYEDVTSLVEERLKAKEERRKARKEEKKRSRPSEDASMALQSVPGDEKPKKKKVKTEETGDARGKAERKAKKQNQRANIEEGHEGRKLKKAKRADD